MFSRLLNLRINILKWKISRLKRKISRLEKVEARYKKYGCEAYDGGRRRIATMWRNAWNTIWDKIYESRYDLKRLQHELHKLQAAIS
jgi:hypothetical protein